MSQTQWESLCDGCGRCCLHKLHDVDTDEILYTAVACRLLDPRSCRCKNYLQRQKLIPDCVVLDRSHIGDMSWLPETCAYRRLDEGNTLADWHPLISGDPDSVHRAGISVRGRTVSEEGVHDDDFEEYLISWVPVAHRVRPKGE